MSYSEILADWSTQLEYQDLPGEVIKNTRLRILDVLGLSLAGVNTPFGQSVIKTACNLSGAGDCHIIGTGDKVNVAEAAFANGALSQALEFDDTHNKSIVHMSGPAVSAALAMAEKDSFSGKDIITAIALGNEISCRLGSMAPQQFHRRGFHPTGVFAPFGVTFLTSWLINANKTQTVNAVGNVGSFAAGLLQCWVDGTKTKFLHPGWAAQSGIHAAVLGLNGTTGPLEVIEGRFGLMAAHLQDDNIELNAGILLKDLGDHWESENASFKPFPVAHVIHPYIDAILRLQKTHDIDCTQIQKIHCPVPEYIVGIVCEPLNEKCRPNTDSHGRVSLQFTLAEALVTGKIDKNSYSADSLSNDEIHALADKIEYEVDESFPGPEQFKGEVTVFLKNGSKFTETEEFNRGSRQNPMTVNEIIQKFLTNSAEQLNTSQQEMLIEQTLKIENCDNAANLLPLTFNQN